MLRIGGGGSNMVLIRVFFAVVGRFGKTSDAEWINKVRETRWKQECFVVSSIHPSIVWERQRVDFIGSPTLLNTRIRVAIDENTDSLLLPWNTTRECLYFLSKKRTLGIQSPQWSVGPVSFRLDPWEWWQDQAEVVSGNDKFCVLDSTALTSSSSSSCCLENETEVGYSQYGPTDSLRGDRPTPLPKSTFLGHKIVIISTTWSHWESQKTTAKMRLWDRDWRGVDSWPVLQRAKMRPTTRWIKKTKTNANKIPSTKHIFDQQRQQQWWQWQQSTNGNNASKNISSSSSNDKDLYICASDNSYKVRVLLDTLERSVSCCSGPKFRMRRSEGTTTGSMSVWNADNLRQGYSSTSQQSGGEQLFLDISLDWCYVCQVWFSGIIFAGFVSCFGIKEYWPSGMSTNSMFGGIPTCSSPSE